MIHLVQDDSRAQTGVPASAAPAPRREQGVSAGTTSDGPTTTALRSVRAGLGAGQLLCPGLAARVLAAQHLDDRARRVVRVLGARQVAQAVLTGTRPSHAVLVLGTGVDALHAASMVFLALFDRRLRRAALADAFIALGFAGAGFTIMTTRGRGGRRV
ncbi:MAG TPA: hypothetical protein VFW24_15855 [Acidimicrobiales bacterium]|nr:hypothetical protein [Acidimicrobiales bacterium]